MTDLIVPRRFCGPPSSGNGGYTAGALAARHQAERPGNRAERWPALEVSLRQPPPLDTPMLLAEDGEAVTASFGGAVIASVRRVADTLREVDAVPAEQARAASAAYPGLRFHPFPTCFVCGTERAERDGLRIFPGPVPGGLAAASWTPHPSLAEDYHTYVDEVPRASLATTWAALDCVGGWAGDLAERLMVLGRMTARVETLPVIGEEHVVVGSGRGQQGRKTYTASTLYDADGRVVATAEHLWVAVDPARFGGNVPIS